MKRFAVVLSFVVACGGGTAEPTARPGEPAVYERIAAHTDCRQLQEEFDTAEEHGKTLRAAGRLEQARWTTEYMQAADTRMRELGCYK